MQAAQIIVNHAPRPEPRQRPFVITTSACLVSTNPGLGSAGVASQTARPVAILQLASVATLGTTLVLGIALRVRARA